MPEKQTINVLQFICPTGFYGAERWILALARHLDSGRIQCNLAVTLESESRDLELVKKYRELQSGEAYEIPMSNRFDFGVINRLVDLIEREKIDIIHTHGYKSDILGVIAAKKAGIKCIVTPHGFENARDLKLRLFIWLGCKAMTYADIVAPLSPQLMQDSLKAGVRQDKLQYIQNGVDLSELETQKQCPSLSKNKHRIGFIGQLISRKNVFDVLDIFDELAGEHDNLELYLVGDGDQRRQLETHASTKKHRQDIHFMGFRDDRLALLQSFDLFVMTSTLEGIPRCLMEACAMEIPVAAYDIDGVNQLITHNETGLLAMLGDRQTLKKQWDRLLFNTPFASKLARNACEYINEHYSAQRMASEYTTLFENMNKV